MLGEARKEPEKLWGNSDKGKSIKGSMLCSLGNVPKLLGGERGRANTGRKDYLQMYIQPGVLKEESKLKACIIKTPTHSCIVGQPLAIETIIKSSLLSTTPYAVLPNCFVIFILTCVRY